MSQMGLNVVWDRLVWALLPCFMYMNWLISKLVVTLKENVGHSLSVGTQWSAGLQGAQTP